MKPPKLTINVTAQIEQLDGLVKQLSELSADHPEFDIAVVFTVNDKTDAESQKKIIETAMREALLKSGIPKEGIVDDVEDFRSQEKVLKTRFVEKELFFLLRAANSKISDTTYCKENGNETVIVTMENGCKYNIDITCDSLLAIANDVCWFMAHK